MHHLSKTYKYVQNVQVLLVLADFIGRTDLKLYNFLLEVSAELLEGDTKRVEGTAKMLRGSQKC